MQAQLFALLLVCSLASAFDMDACMSAAELNTAYANFSDAASQVCSLPMAMLSSLQMQSMEAIYDVLHDFLMDNDDIYSAAYGMSPEAAIAILGMDIASPFCVRDITENITCFDIAESGYNHTDASLGDLTLWYVEPTERIALDASFGGYWTEPYLDEGGAEIVIVSFSVPFISEGLYMGVVTGDFVVDL